MSEWLSECSSVFVHVCVCQRFPLCPCRIRDNCSQLLPGTSPRMAQLAHTTLHCSPHQVALPTSPLHTLHLAQMMPQPTQLHTHGRVHTRTHTHACTRMYIHTHRHNHTHRQTDIHALTHVAQTNTRTHSRTHAHIHTHRADWHSPSCCFETHV